jgi:hypothetical protein
MAGNGRGSRSRGDYAADVAQAVRAGALSAQDLMSRPASGRPTTLLKLDVEQLTEGSGRPPHNRMGVRSPTGAYRGLAAKCPTDGFRESLARFRAERILSRFWRCVQPPAEHDGSPHFSHPA